MSFNFISNISISIATLFLCVLNDLINVVVSLMNLILIFFY